MYHLAGYTAGVTDVETEPAPTGQAARWAGQRERRRTEFVEAALEAITEYGPAASVEQIAARAGVARTRIYRHFTDRADLEQAISARVAELIVAELDPLWHPEGSTNEMIAAVIGPHVRWLAAHRHLYGYLVAHSGVAHSGVAHSGYEDDPANLDGYVGVRHAVGLHLTGLFGGYLALVAVDGAVAESLAFGVLGLVESTTNRWLERGERGLPVETADELAAQLSAWVWAMLDQVLRAAGVELDPDLPLPPLV